MNHTVLLSEGLRLQVVSLLGLQVIRLSLRCVLLFGCPRSGTWAEGLILGLRSMAFSTRPSNRLRIPYKSSAGVIAPTPTLKTWKDARREFVV